MIRTGVARVSLIGGLLLLAGCQTAYYATMEKLGVDKRHIMADRVASARDSQAEAREQFASALEQFSAVLGFEGGSLEDKYKDLKSELERSEEKADEVHDRIDAVEDVSQALFEEWEAELGQYSSASLRESSKRQLNQTRREYQRLMRAMKRAEARLEPVLKPLRDQVLFLKHNLNARAIASLKSELGSIESDVAILINELELAIAESEKFIKTLE